MGVFLGARLDTSILANILDDIDTGVLRSAAADSLDDNLPQDTGEHMTLAMDAMKDLSTVLKALGAAHRTGKYPKLDPLLDQCLEMVHERWGDVTKCIMFLAQTIVPVDPEWADVIPACLLVIEPLAYQPEKTTFSRISSRCPQLWMPYSTFFDLPTPRLDGPLRSILNMARIV